MVNRVHHFQDLYGKEPTSMKWDKVKTQKLLSKPKVVEVVKRVSKPKFIAYDVSKGLYERLADDTKRRQEAKG